MKKLGIIILLIALIHPIFGQRSRGYSSKKSTVKWLSIAPRAGYGSGLLINSAVFDDAHITGEKRSPSNFIGARLGITHGDNIGISFIGGKSSFTQNYTAFGVTSIDNYTKSYAFSAVEYGVMFRFTSNLGFILEIGPRKVNLKSALGSIGGNILVEASDIDLMDTILQSYTTINLSLGQSLLRSDRTELNLTIQASYGFKDLFNGSGYNYIQDRYYNYTNVDFYNAYVNNVHTTNPLTVMVTLEFNYFFAFWGDASCGRGRFLMFQ
jgi:hypothetical protein